MFLFFEYFSAGLKEARVENVLTLKKIAVARRVFPEIKTCVYGGEVKTLRLKDGFPHSLTLESLVELESETNYHLVLNFSVVERCCCV